MKKIYFIIIATMIMVSFLMAGRKSSDKVPTTNSLLNTHIQDVVGNKGDTTNGSIVALLVSTTNSSSTVDALLDVPSVDSTNNNQSRDVVGNKSDTEDGTSIMSIVAAVKNFLFVKQEVYPTNAAAIALTNAAEWITGGVNVVVASNVIASPFTITGIAVESIATNEESYQIKLYYGVSDTVAGEVRFARTIVTGPVVLPMQTIKFGSNEIITAGLASAGGNTNRIATISLLYHKH